MDNRKTNTSVYNNSTFSMNFEKASKDMIATSNNNGSGTLWDNHYRKLKLRKDYTPEEVERIIKHGSLLQQQYLSKSFFETDGFYKKLLIYYANLYLYNGILIPNPMPGTNLSQKAVQKRYWNACNFLDKVDLKSIFSNCALNVLIYGTYYGVIQTLDKDALAILDLPASYCRSRYKNKQGIDLIEFDVSYFDTIIDEAERKLSLKAFPTHVSSWYKRWKDGKVQSRWAFIPAESGICFPMFDGRPLFLEVIPAAMDYDAAVDTEKERDLDEIKKIIVQKISHLQDGSLLFEPDEVAVMHEGTVNMLKNNPNVSVLTTYGDVDAIVSKTASEAASNNLEKMMKNIYYQAGTSSQIFSADSNLAIETSIYNDMSVMSSLISKFSVCITSLINRIFGNTNIFFKYIILPVTQYNQLKYADSTFKFATSGYSYLIPAIALGLSQTDIISLKDLENNVLKLDEKFKPLGSAYTNSIPSTQNSPGAPKKDASETSNKTEQNQISLEKQGGSTN